MLLNLQKLVVVLGIFMPMTTACKMVYTFSTTENSFPPTLNVHLLKHTLCIHHLFHFKKDQIKVQALLNSGNKFNVIAPAYATSLDLKIRSTNVKAWKIDGFTFLTFNIPSANFKVNNKFL